MRRGGWSGSSTRPGEVAAESRGRRYRQAGHSARPTYAGPRKMAVDMGKINLKKIARNVGIIAAVLFFLMVITPTRHDKTPVFSEDGNFQISSQELVKHFQTSKWKMPMHEINHVKDFYDYLENPTASCVAYALLGGRACHEIEDHVVCLDPSLGLDHENCLVYAFGETTNSFEKAMVKLGCNVYTFDAAGSRVDHRRGDRSWVYRLRLAGNDSAVLPGDKVMTLEEVQRAFGHRARRIDYLKLDLDDGEEWAALRRVMTTRALDAVQQLGVHVTAEVLDLAPRQRLALLQAHYQVLVGLEHSGLRLVSARPQMEDEHCGALPELDPQRRVCEYYELVFARR